ncbi:major facilitator superfamily protein [Stylonychia lemnae]|uniref:Major facilitator superfamily protein n=1 Tax=Stylonychia lemnae TaxID=5949 RepID=A0A077ZS89_STYLE|nr:major facilitator superfamily protein [Stylonychia lemnae]|eukprot:CDW72384.1 major facilitator superfamily protein [Stylonychia lemnae]
MKFEKNQGKVTLLAIGFLFLFIAFNSADNLAAKIMKEDGFDNMGFYSMSLLYLAFAFGSFFSTAIVNKIGVKFSLFIGGLCYFFRIFCFLFPAYYNENKEYREQYLYLKTGFIDSMILVSAMINGLGSGILWTSQGKYVSSCATDENKGFFFSYFFFIFMISQILGNLIAAFVIRANGQPTYYIIMSSLSFFGSLVFLFLTQPSEESKVSKILKDSEIIVDNKKLDSIVEKQELNQNLINTLERQTLGIVEIADLQKDPYKPKKDQVKVRGKFKQDLIDVFQMLVSKKMRKIIPLIIWSALSLATFAGSFVTMMTATMKEYDWSENEQLEMSLLAMIPLGLGEMSGSVIIGKIMDKYGQKIAIITCSIKLSISILLILAYIAYFKYSVLTFFVTFFWGFQDSNLNNILNCILGFEFESNTVPFSVYSLVQAIFVFIFMIVQSLILTRTDYFIYFSVCYAYGIVSLFILYTFDFKKKKNDQEKIQLSEDQGLLEEETKEGVKILNEDLIENKILNY